MLNPLFYPRLILQTLHRGDGLLGMLPSGALGPRGASVTIARVDWLYIESGDRDKMPAQQYAIPLTMGGADPASMADGAASDQRGNPVTLIRDNSGEASAMRQFLACRFHAIPATALQWRHDSLLRTSHALWSLTQEEFFGDFWADQLPLLQAQGWRIVVLPGFAHESVPVEAWRLMLEPVTGDSHCKEVAVPLRLRSARGTALRAAPTDGSWLLSLGVQINGETLDLVPMLAQLLQRDLRWLSVAQIATIDDGAIVRLRAPGGRRIDAPAAPLKIIVLHLLDLLIERRRKVGPLKLSRWDIHRLDALRQALSDSCPQRAGLHGQWQLQGAPGLAVLVDRLRQAGTVSPIAAPTGLGVQLRPYQLQGLAWLQYLRQNDLGGILADDMGLGKTAQVLAHILLEKQAGRLICPALVVLPTSLVFNWQAEAQRMTPDLRVLTLQGGARAAQLAGIGTCDLVLTSYALIWRDLDRLRPHHFHMLILDEAQLVKNPHSRAAAALRRIKAKHRLCITGTPLENHLGELWSQFDFLLPGFLGDQRSFQRQWRRPIEVNGETVRAGLLAQRVRPFILRRRKVEVANELPARIEILRKVRLEGQQRALYESVRAASDQQVRRMLQRQGFGGAQISILDALLKLRQVCCDPFLLQGVVLAPDIERAKFALLRELLPELVEAGRRILVFSQFATLLGLLETELDALQLPWLSLTGSTAPAQRGALVRRFQAQAVPIFLLSLKAGGVGLNLTAADTVIHLDPWWNPAVEEQATARAHRIGQDKSVLVIRIVVEGSIEERILALQQRKAGLAEAILGSDAASARKFDADDLAALLAPLPPLAVERN